MATSRFQFVIHSYSHSIRGINLDNINSLIRQLNPKNEPINEEMLKEVVKNSIFITIYDRTMPLDKGGYQDIGIAQLSVIQKLTGRQGKIDDVIINEAHRGQGLGERLMKVIIKKAKQLKLDSLELTTNPKRGAANALYQKMGFVPRETNVYRLNLTED